MSYRLTTRLHRSTLQTFLLIVLTVVCFFNFFIPSSGSLRNNLDNTNSGSSATTPPGSSNAESFLDPEHSLLVPEDSIITGATTTDNYLETAAADGLNTLSVENVNQNLRSLPTKLSSKDLNKSAMAKERQEDGEIQKTTNTNQKKTSQKNRSRQGSDLSEEVLAFLKHKDHKHGINNVDTELHLTTVENAKEKGHETSDEVQGRSTKVSPSNLEGRQSEHLGREDDYYDEDEDDDYYEDNEEEDDIETIILNSDQPTIQQLPFCKQTTTETGNQKSAVDDGSNSTSSNDQIVAAAKRKGLNFSRKQIVVATLDGNISFLDQTGKMHWTFSTGEFFSSTISSVQLSENGKMVKLIPSLTGGLYKYDGQSLQAMPLTADSLLRKSFKLVNDVVITGGKELKTFGLDIYSGNVKYECGMDGCKPVTTTKVEAGASIEEDKDNKIVLVVKRQLQTVRAIESTTGTERWNFSVATHELAIAGLTEGCYESASIPLEGSEKNHMTITKFFRMVIPEGLIFGADERNQVIWQHKFNSPISQAWVLENGRLTIVDPIKCAPLMEEAPSLYVGIHQQQLYVQESQATAKRIKSVLELDSDADDNEPINTTNGNQRRIEWIPQTVAIRSDNTAVSSIYSGPFYVYDREQVIYDAIEHNGSSKIEDPNIICAPEDKEKEQANQDAMQDTGIVLTIAILLYYWKEVLGISLLTTIILLIPVVRIVRNRTARQLYENLYQGVATILTRLQLQQQENERALVLYQNSPGTDSTRISSSMSSPMLNELNRTRTTSSSSNQSFVDDQIVPFVSQYIREFDPIQCLGRGGFGVVFEARKKIDDRTYAVKRIPLPNRAKSRDRVMREVKALAKLEHKNIVRYFNAWIENPPVGWLERNDPLWNQVVLSSPSPTSEYPSEIGASEDSCAFTQFNNKLRKDYYEISLSGFTPDKETNNDDSFIVFATSEEEITEEENQVAAVNENNASPVEIINISNSNSKNRESDDGVEERLWKSSDSYENENSIYNNNSYGNEQSKFFVRPTTLDIPSTPSNKSLSNSDQFNEASDSPVGLMYLYIQQELCQKRTLQEWLVIEKQRDLLQVVKMFIQIVEAVEYIHSNRLIHRDLKPSNIFLADGSNSTTSLIIVGDESQLNGKEMTVKIGDFGLVTTSTANKLPDENDTTIVDGRLNSKLTGLVGTTLYMSYEQSQKKSYDHKVDIYSLGLIFFEMIVPFATNMERYDLLSKVRGLAIPPFFVQSYPEENKLIRRMVSHTPENRPEASEIKYWLNQHLQTLNSESALLENNDATTSVWQRSKSTPSADKRFINTDKEHHKMAKILKAHSFI